MEGEIPPIQHAPEIAPSLPRVIYDEGLKDAPYRIEVDREGAGALLQMAGVPEEQMRATTIRVARKSSAPWYNPFGKLIGAALGTYQPRDKAVTLYGDSFWQQQQRRLNKAEQILSKQTEQATQAQSPEMQLRHLSERTTFLTQSPKNQFPGMSSGERLSWYLTVAPPERGLETAKRLINRAMERDISLTLQHEAKHAGDFMTNKALVRKDHIVKGAFIGAGVVALAGYTAFLTACNLPPALNVINQLGGDAAIGLLMVASEYQAGILEQSARGFQKQLEHESKYRFVTMSPKADDQNLPQEV